MVKTKSIAMDITFSKFRPGFLLLVMIGWGHFLLAQHTFSIAAVDPVTGEVGSAGATCLSNSDCGGCGGAVVISQLTPGKGAINAQASVCIPNSNALNGNGQINMGQSASQTLAYLLGNDACSAGDTSNRQYGIATLDGNMMPDVAAFTGSNALGYAGQRVGATYAIQGNILLGPEILDSMEARFNASAGQPLCDRLMEALQGANVPGADSRCLSNGTSSKSSYIRVAKPGDGVFIWLNLVLSEVPPGVEPIDSLNTVFTEWKLLNGLQTPRPPQLDIYPSPTRDRFRVQIPEAYLAGGTVKVYNELGQLVHQEKITAGNDAVDLRASAWKGSGVYLVAVELEGLPERSTGKVLVW